MYQHLWAEINLDALSYNIEQIKRWVGSKQIMGVVKANAYGHGAGAVTKLLCDHGVTSFAVSNTYEAIDLREHGISGDILLLGYADPAAANELIERQVTVCIYDTESANRLQAAAAKAGGKLHCHIKLDSGMSRLGFDCRSDRGLAGLAEQLEPLFRLPNLIITGAFTHFAAADRDNDPDGSFTAAQYRRFDAACDLLRTLACQNGQTTPLLFHSANSAATLLEQVRHPSDLYRAGIILYGLTPSSSMKLPFALKPVMSLKATVAQIKTIEAGDSISYGRTFTADRQMRVATVTAGYADGYMRGLSNCGYMLICGKKAPILGRVCMDQTVVDVTHIPEAQSGDTAVLFGEGLPVEELAALLDTINYELVCAVAHRVPRVYKKDGEITDTIRYHSI